jgi:hypothetical protein
MGENHMPTSRITVGIRVLSSNFIWWFFEMNGVFSFLMELLQHKDAYFGLSIGVKFFLVAGSKYL